MTYTVTNLTAWLGATLSAQLSSDQLNEAIQDATDYCSGYLTAMGVGTGGSAYDAAMRYVSRASVLRQLDAMGIKPSGLDMGGTLSISSDVGPACEQLTRMADERLKMAYLTNAGNKAGAYIYRNRGGQGAY